MHDEYDYDYDDRRPRRRPPIIEQRLRRSRGEVLADFDDDDYYDERPVRRGRRYAPAPAGGGGGCAQATLYIVLGGLIVLLIGMFALNQAAGQIGSMLPDAPDISTLVITPTPQIVTGAAVVQRIQQLNRIETASYTIERVIDVRQASSVPVIGDLLASDELLLIAHGTVVAGIDLSELTPDSVVVTPDGSRITMSLPPVRVFSSALDNEQTRVYSRERGIFAPDNKDLETLARQNAEAQILQAACEGGIMQEATESAKRSIEQFLRLMGFTDVLVTTAAPATCMPSFEAPAPAATPVP
jgi:hypothetical protein